MSDLINAISQLDKDQLESLREVIDERLKEKREEEMRTVWRVCDLCLCLGNFREEEYLKAAEFLLETAKEMMNDPSLCDKEKCLELKCLRVSASEYEEYVDG
ncbi:hypothetical protein SMW93_003623 [Cronobacter sakazakii]|uniref:hypothetical protein n=1 Tax=Cronobacter sakazakii TaxID=28141 RepID=UPI000CFBDE5A|nr:hypothetical protein [Cronobacter sakazakii]ELY3414410.1 hypothetical protein [Cronobacter sakazakii]ELY4752660.1 hypothetical protein [Cronobacter sakazakii]ELY5779456.1 hypothetical protein [Cronobacter sakazakii]